MTAFLLRVNRIQPAFGFEFGLDSPRANEGRATNPYGQANVSYSLVQRQDGHVVRHTLIDCGMGVIPSLLEFEQSHGVHVVHEVLLTYPHLDHFAQLDWLSMCLLRSGRPDQPLPLPIYASPECWTNGPNGVHRYLAGRSDFRPLRRASPSCWGVSPSRPSQWITARRHLGLWGLSSNMAAERSSSRATSCGFPRKTTLCCSMPT